MCIAIYRPKGKELSKKTLAQCWDNNSDGAGFMYVDNGQLIVEKGFFKFKPFWKTVREFLHEKDRDIVLHFRIATSGKVDYDNCHPHFIHDGLAYVHNGVITELNNDKDKCDTVRLAEILSHLQAGFIYDEHIMALVEMAVGYSKFVFMDNTGAVKIIGREKGIEVGDVWFSNDSFRRATYRSYIKSSDYYGYNEYGDYGTDGVYRYAPASRYTYNSQVSSPTTQGKDAKVSATMGLDERQVVDPTDDLPFSFGFQDGQRYDVDMPVGIVDEWGFSASDYERHARREALWWCQQRAKLDEYAWRDIIEIATDDGEIRLLLQDWLDLYEPSYYFTFDDDYEENDVPPDNLASDRSEAISEVVNATTVKLTAPVKGGGI